MLGLWWLGSMVEQLLGHGRYLGLYFAAGLAGSAGALLASPDCSRRSAPPERSTGSSAHC